MGELLVEKLTDSPKKAKYIKQLLTDIEALELMFEKDMFEKDRIRIGAEQEFCLVGDDWEPSSKALEILKAIDDTHFTTELARYNLEINLDPLLLTGDSFSKMHRQLNLLLEKARAAAKNKDAKVVLTGVLPTIASRHLELSNITPIKRYIVLNEAITELRKDDIELHIKGVDEINLHHKSILFEGCNTSFQSHLQINPDDFVDAYNWAQAIAGPILSICTNSPLLMGRELWQESRIALFTQSVDTRASTYLLNERESRVGFGHDWIKGTVTDFFKEEIIRFRGLLTADFTSDSLTELKNGNIPKLKALGLHNGTIYKWNRPCYGVTAGKPHIRIENRYLPSGPTAMDEIANMMFWVGVMQGRPKTFDALHTKMDFKDAKGNFYNAARYGTAAQFYWAGQLIPCKELLLDHLLPMAFRGLYKMNILPEDAEKYLSVIENRIKTKNGSAWTVQSYRKLRKKNKKPDALRILVSEMYKHERKGYNIDAWRLVSGDEIVTEKEKKVGQYMTTKTITAQQTDSAELVLKMMQWKNIHHVPIQDKHWNLVGLLTWTDVKQFEKSPKKLGQTVQDLMKIDLITVTRDTSVEKAKRLMQDHKINCLPIVNGKKLVGIITSKDV